jgi:peptidoglycan/LPS O-acetylase OafA/YrhL
LPAAGSTPPVSGAATGKGFRLDIQGLRGFALVLVLLCHANLPFAAGGYVGLDVFFVLSGFLITGLIVGEIERSGRLSVIGFYGRRAKRLLPLAVTVLVAILAGSALIFSTLQREAVGGDVLAAALYIVNWRFTAQSVDYFDAGDVSPVQHFWSLSVEEQFYFVWPLLLIFGAWWARQAGRNLRPSLLWVVAPVGIISLAYSIQFSVADPEAAYFSTATRLWELAAGGTLALLLPAGTAMGRRTSALLVVAGVAVLLATMAVYDPGTAYPGWRALLPVLAAIAIIVAGTARTVSAPVRLLTREPFQHLGRVSYAWYLWHWPALIFAAALLGELSPPMLLVITALSWIPAVITHHLIEEPLRRSRSLGRRPRKSLAVGLGFTSFAVVAVIAMQAAQPKIPVAQPSAAPGAMVSGPAPVPQRMAAAVRPHPRDVREDRGELYEDGCMIWGSNLEPGPCVYGDPTSKTTVVLLGDSHALQYFPALRRLAEQRRWRLVGLVRAGCVIADVDYRPHCNEWRKRILRRIHLRERPSLIVVSNATASRYKVVRGGSRLDRDASQPLLETGFARTLLRLQQTGARLAVIRDQPMAPRAPAECVAESLRRLDRCAFAAERSDERSFDARAARDIPGVRLIDPMPVLCPNGRCPAVIGNVVVYRDTYHLTATFARTMTAWLDRQLPQPA